MVLFCICNVAGLFKKSNAAMWNVAGLIKKPNTSMWKVTGVFNKQKTNACSTTMVKLTNTPIPILVCLTFFIFLLMTAYDMMMGIGK